VLKKIEEFRTYVEITGFSKVKVGSLQAFMQIANRGKPANVEVQFFDAGKVASWQHLYFAALNALTAFNNRINISRTLGMETLLYAAGERQITKATEKMGIKSVTREVAVLAVGKDREAVESANLKILRNIGGEQDDMVLELSGSKNDLIRRAFNIGETELETVMRTGDLEKALVDVVVERMALISCQR
jgi:KEOPS complex subunit Cgi121